MNLRWKRITGYGLVTVVFSLIALTYLWKPGISVQNAEELDTKLRQKIARVLDPQARITYLHLDGFGASRKFRYAILTYLLPGGETCYTCSLYLDGTGGTFGPDSRAATDGILYEDGILPENMNLAAIAANVRRIRDELVKEEKEWMGISEYSIRFDPQTRDFVHETKVGYETGATLFQWAFDWIFGVTPGEWTEYIIRQNGRGELEKKEK